MHFRDKVATVYGVQEREGPRFGIELEYEGSKAGLGHENIYGWKIERDPSLRNNGVEFVSHVLRPASVPLRLGTAQKIINTYKLVPHKRCGVHVHLNVSDCTLKELWTIMTLYILTEPYIFAAFAPDRTDNHFCVPWWFSDNIAEFFRQDIEYLRLTETKPRPQPKKKTKKKPKTAPGGLVLDPVIFDEIQYTVGGGSRLNLIQACPKYAALNTKPVRRFGTLEFRHLAATTNLKEVQRWCDFLLLLREEALKYPDPQAVLDEYNERGAEGLCGDLNIPTYPIPPEDIEDSEFLAATACGGKPVPHTKLKWTPY